MATRPSRAAAAAATSARPTPTGGHWTLPMVEKAAAVFAELPTLPAFDKDAIAARVAAWYRFVDVVAEGAVAPEAAPLAADVVRFGAAFLQAHPEHVLVGGAVWTLADVEAVARWFGAARSGSVDGGVDGGVDSVGARVAAFERVVRSGLVADDARPLALALLEAMEAWQAA